MQKYVSASLDYDYADENLRLTRSKRSAADSLDDMENVQLWPTKLMKDIKKEK